MPIISIENDAHWHRLRHDHIGASEIGALFMNPSHDEPGAGYVSRHALWSRLCGRLPNMEPTPLMEFGHDMEPIIAKWLDETFQLGVMPCKEYHTHPEHQWLGCTLDRYALTYNPEGSDEVCPAIIEIKHVSGPWVKAWTQVKCPPYVELQIQDQLLVVNAARKALGFTPFKWAIGGVMMGGNPEDLRLYPRQAMPEVQEAIMAKSQDFWHRCVLNGEEPDVDQPGDVEHIRKMFLSARIDEEIIDLSAEAGEIAEMVLTWREAKAAEKFHANRKELFKARLMRACMILDAEDIVGYTIGRTDEYDIVITKGTQRRGEAVSDVLKFDVKERR